MYVKDNRPIDYSLYIVTDEGLSHGFTHLEIAIQAVRGGATVIQLRDKTKTARELVQIAQDIRAVTKRAGALCIINDRLDIALGTADGVHLGQDDLPLSIARQLAPPPFIIGISVGSIAQAKQAEREGADYIAVSPVFGTSSKSDAGPGHGLHILSEIVHAVNIPIIGIGGINHSNLHYLFEAGASGVAVISAVVSADDIETATCNLKKQILCLNVHS